MTQVELGIKINIDGNKVAVDGIDQVTAATTRMGAEAENVGQTMAGAQKELGNSTAQLTVGQLHYMDSLRDQAAAVGMNKTALLEMKAAQLGLTEEAAPMIAQIAAATAATGNHTASMSSNMAKMESMRVIHDAMIGSYTRMGSSMLVLGNATGVTAMLFNPLTLGVLAATAAAIGLYAAFAAGKSEQDGMNTALAVTSNYAGMSSDHMMQLADSMTQSKEVTIGTSTAIVTALVASGKIGGAAIQQITKFTSDYAKSTGQDIATIAPAMIKLFEDPLAGANELNRSMHFLTTTDIEHIATLQRLGDVQGAQLALAKDVTDHMPVQAKNIGTVTQWLNTEIKAWTDLGHAIMDIGKIQSDAQKAQGMRDQISIMRASGVSTKDPSIVAIQAQIDALAPLVAKQKEVTAAEQAAAAANKLQADSWDKIKASASSYHIQELKDSLTLIEQHKSEPGAGFVAQETAKRSAIDQTTKAIQDAQRAVGADARALTQGQITAQEALDQIKIKSAADDINTQAALGNITKSQQDAMLTNNSLDAISSKTLFDQKMLQISGLTAAQRQGYEEDIKHNQALSDAAETAGINKQLVDEKTDYDAIIKSVQAVGVAETQQLDAAIAKQRQHNDEIGKNASQKELVLRDINAGKLAQSESDAQYLQDVIKKTALDDKSLAIYTARLNYINQEIADRKELIGLSTQGAALDAGVEQQRLLTQQFKDAGIAAKQMEADLTSSFGNIGTAIGKMAVAFTDYGKTQNDIQLQYLKGVAAAEGADKEYDLIKAAQTKFDKDSSVAQMKNYADMAGAAEQFFTKGSTGYKALQEVQQIYRVAEMLMANESTVLQVWGYAQTALSSATSAITQVTSSAAVGTAAAATGVAIQAQGDPYTAWIRMGAMVATMAALGFAIAGVGGSGSSAPDPSAAAQMQKTQGTGTVLGDAAKQSDSIVASMTLLTSNSSAMLPLTAQMADSLKNMENGVTGVATLISGNSSAIASGLNLGIQVGKSSSGLMGDIFGSSSTTISDAGLQFGGSVASLQKGNGVQQYATENVDTKGGWFSGGSNTTNNVTGAVSDQVTQQFGLIFQNLQTTLQTAATALGKSSTDVGTAIQNTTISVSQVSLQGLSGTAQIAALNAVIGAAMDKVTSAVLPGMEVFAQMGETYTDTVIRVATGVEQAQVALQAFGITAINYTGILNKQGDVGAEIVRQSIDAVETATNGALTGVGKIISVASGAASDLASLYSSLLAMRQLMNDTAGNGMNLSQSMINGAGGSSQLSTGLSDFLKDYFTPAEQSASELKDLSAQFSVLNESMPTTKDGFRAMISGIDTSTDAGQKLYGQLMALSGAFSTAVDNANALTTATSASTVAAQHALDEQLLQAQGNTAAYTAATRSDVLSTLTGNLLATQQAIYDAQDAATAQAAKATAVATATTNLTNAYNAQNTALTATITKYQAFVDSLTAFGLSLSTGALSTLSPEAQYNQDKATFQSTSAAAATGDPTALGNLQTVAQQFLTDSKAYNASTQAYADDYAAVQKGITDSTAAANQQVSIAQTQLTVMQAQVSSLITINASVLSVAAAMSAYTAATSGSSGSSATSGVFASGAAGTSSYTAQQLSAAASGQVWSELDNGAAYMAHHPLSVNNGLTYVANVPGFAAGGDHAGGLRIVGENGPELEMTGASRIFNAAQTKQLLSGGDSKETMAELKEQTRQLRALVTLQSAANQALLDKLSQSNVALTDIQKKAKREAAKP
jgi:phage-related minor tail protein